MAVDVLAVCAHPDDAELACAGLLLNVKHHGARVGVVDMTRGELGTRGSPEQRAAEREAASAVLGLDIRLNLDLPDGFVEPTLDYRTRLVEVIRAERPRMIVAPYWEDHHPDHANTSRLAKDAWWSAGVAKHPGGGDPHRPEMLLFYTSRMALAPSIVVDVTAQFATKREAVLCYRSQLFRERDDQATTHLSRPEFLDAWEGRHRYYGNLIGVTFGEPYVLRNPVPVANPLALLDGRPGVM